MVCGSPCLCIRHTAQALDDRKSPLQLLLHADRQRTGTRGFAADVEQVGAFRYQALRISQRIITLQMLPAIRKRIRRDIDDTHDQRPGEIELEGAAEKHVKGEGGRGKWEGGKPRRAKRAPLSLPP